MKNGDALHKGTVANLNELGYDVLDAHGRILRHVTTGDVRCELGVCDHEVHQHSPTNHKQVDDEDKSKDETN